MNKTFKTLTQLSATIFLLASCTVNYDFDMSKITEKNRLVVNSILSPSQPLKVSFYTIDRQADGRYGYSVASGVDVRLTENGSVVYEGVCPDSVLLLDYRPKTNASYRIEVRKDGYDAVWAETAIPGTVTCDATTRMASGGYMPKTPISYLTGFAGFGSENQSALYISAYDQEEKVETEHNWEHGVLVIDTISIDTIWTKVNYLYSRNFFIDIINRANWLFIHEEVGSLYFESFMRVRAENVSKLDTVAFATDGPPIIGRKIRVITAGRDYDRYLRTAYEQNLYHISEDDGGSDLNALIYQPITIHSNINGGLGIFAGISEIFIEN